MAAFLTFRPETRSPVMHGRSTPDAFGGLVFSAFAAFSVLVTLYVGAQHADKLFHFPAHIDRADAEDLIAFWAGARFAAEGAAANAYDPALFRAALPDVGERMLFLNPPTFFLLIAPLAFFSYAAAKALWIGGSVAAISGIAACSGTDRRSRVTLALALLLSPACFASLFVLQLAPAIALGLLCALLVSDKRPWLSAALLALLTVKPQFGLMVPVFLLARGETGVVLRTIAATSLFALLSIAVFGIDPWRTYFASMSGVYGEHAAGIYRGMLTVHQSIGKLGFGEPIRSLAQAFTTLLAACAVWRAARKWSRADAVALTLIATAFAAPSLWVYDWLLVSAGLALLTRAGVRWPLGVQLAAVAAWIAPLYALHEGADERTLGVPLVLAALLAALVWWKEKAAGAAQSRPAAPAPAEPASAPVSAG